MESRHAGEEHETEKDIDWSPRFHEVPLQLQLQVDQIERFASPQKDHGSDCLEDDQDGVDILLVDAFGWSNEFVVAVLEIKEQKLTSDSI